MQRDASATPHIVSYLSKSDGASAATPKLTRPFLTTNCFHLAGNEASNGWPLGLMSTRLRVMETIQAAPAETYSLRIRSSSFSSFSSSNLDTESTASFFQDRSVPLGRLIGIRPGNGGLHFPRRVHADEREKIAIRAIRAASSEVSGARRADMSHGICIRLLAGTLEKMSRSKSKSRQ
ncbi:hypothetical protein D5086_008083 [Populus alba]|uniref:Uncharacterized protein n=1 Tax=Populus alba TaxID=43335 RepID=A0ACC4CFH6_POPAL